MVSLNSPKNHIHFIGVGGIGMSALAFVLIQRGYSVSGSDKHTNETISKLSNAGIQIFKEQKSINIKSICKKYKKNVLIVVSSAIPRSNPELKAAKKEKLEITHRSDILSSLINQQPSILIAGSHGKTTTSTIVSTLLALCKNDPTIIVGGIVPFLKTNGYSGRGKYLVAEADESDGTLVKFRGALGLITNLELDHTDYYKDIKALNKVFKIFGDRCKKLIINYDSINLKNIFSNAISYSIKTSKDVNYAAIPVLINGEGTIAKYFENEKLVDTIKIPLIGSHNLSNSLGSIAICREVGVDFNELKKNLKNIESPERRFDIKGIWEGKHIIDDYAHHPTEIKATISMSRLIIDNQENILSKNAKRLIIVFQPHRYSRTKDLMEEFAKSFDKSDMIFLLPIYSAGESPLDGINSEYLASIIKKQHPRIPIKLAQNYKHLKDLLRLTTVKDDLILFLGAGNINQFSKNLLEKNKNNLKEMAA